MVPGRDPYHAVEPKKSQTLARHSLRPDLVLSPRSGFSTIPLSQFGQRGRNYFMATFMNNPIGASTHQPLISVIIPCHNEAARIERTIEAVISILEPTHYRVEVVAVDDGSTDDTRRTLDALQQRWPAIVHLICFETNHGKGYAIREGFLQSRGDAVGFIDADMEYPVQALPIMADMVLTTSHTCAIASRVSDDRPRMERLSSHLAHKVASAVLQLPVRDTQAGVKMFPGQFARTTLAQCRQTGWLYDIEALLHAAEQRFEIVEVPVMQKSVRRRRASLFTMMACGPALFTLARSRRRTLRNRRPGPKIGEVARFGLVGITNSLVDLAAYWSLVRLWSPGHNGYQAGFESLLAWIVASLVGYTMHSRFTFHRRLPRAGFYLVTGFGVSIQVVTTGVVTSLGGPHLAVIGKTLGILLASLVTYSGYRLIARSSPEPYAVAKHPQLVVRQADIPVVE